MRERGHAAVLSHERHGLDGTEPDARDVRGRVLREKRVERRVVAFDVALLEQRLREMGPPERTTLRDLEDAHEVHGIAQRVQVPDHELYATSAVLAEPAETVLERRSLRIDEIAEHVRVAPLGFGVELGRRDDPDTEALAGGGGLREPGERVVIGERLDLHPACRCALHQLGRRERTVGAERVRVKVDGVARGYGCHSRSRRSIARARPDASSMSTTTLLNCTTPDATSKRRGRWSRKRDTMIDGSIPRTESRGPTIPVSARSAVPCGTIRPSAVGTCVWLPSTAENRPSRCHPIASFSLVASACQSRMRILGPRSPRSARSASTARNGASCSAMKTRPSALTTSTPSWMTQPLRGSPGARFSGRMQNSSASISLRKARWSQTWFPLVMTSAPAPWISRAISPVRPAPPAAFSPFRITTPTFRPHLTAGHSGATAWRPGFPTTSPTKRTFTPRSARERVQLIDGRVVGGDLRVDVVREAVVLIAESEVGVVDVGRELARRVLRDDRVDLGFDDRRLGLRGVHSCALRQKTRAENVPLRHAGDGRRVGDLREAHGPQLPLGKPIRAALEAAAHEACHRVCHESVLLDALEAWIGARSGALPREPGTRD